MVRSYVFGRLAAGVQSTFHGPTSSSIRLQFRSYCSPSQPSSSKSSVLLEYHRGLPQLIVPMPSRQEPCKFSLRPLTDTVGHLCDSLQREDRGIDYVALYDENETRISITTSIEHVLQFGSFKLRLNDKYFDVSIPPMPDLEHTSDRMKELDDLKATVASLHAALCVDEYKVKRERNLVLQLERAETELRPLQVHKLRIERECEAHAERIMWAGFAYMGIQTGVFARLTWWEYSWDIMEPVTYFATYSSVVATMGYYLYTRQAFDYPAARERVFTKAFYRRAAKQAFDIDKYNKLVTEVEETRRQLSRLRDPLFNNLPISYLTNFEQTHSQRQTPEDQPSKGAE